MADVLSHGMSTTGWFAKEDSVGASDFWGWGAINCARPRRGNCADRAPVYHQSSVERW